MIHAGDFLCTVAQLFLTDAAFYVFAPYETVTKYISPKIDCVQTTN